MDRWMVMMAGALAGMTLTVLAGCEPDDMPAYTPDGKQIVLVTNEAGGEQKVLWVVDPATGTSEARELPDGWKLAGARWLGDKLWVHCQRDEGTLKDKETGKEVLDKKTGQPERDVQYRWAQYDLGTAKFATGVMGVSGALTGPFVGGYQGKAAVFVNTYPREENSKLPEEKEPAAGMMRFRMYEPEGMKEVRPPIEAVRVLTAGMGWWVRCEDKSEGIWRVSAKAEVFDGKGKRRCTVGEKALGAGEGWNASMPDYARVSRDGSVVLLGFRGRQSSEGWLPEYGFMVVEVKTGKKIWGGGSDSFMGTPWVTKDEVWTLEPTWRDMQTGERTKRRLMSNKQESEFVLVRHRAPAKGEENSLRDEFVAYKLEEGDKVSSYAPDAKGEKFLVAVEGKRPKLLIVPMRETVKVSDIVRIQLGKGGDGR